MASERGKKTQAECSTRKRLGVKKMESFPRQKGGGNTREGKAPTDGHVRQRKRGGWTQGEQNIPSFRAVLQMRKEGRLTPYGKKWMEKKRSYLSRIKEKKRRKKVPSNPEEMGGGNQNYNVEKKVKRKSCLCSVYREKRAPTIPL